MGLAVRLSSHARGFSEIGFGASREMSSRSRKRDAADTPLFSEVGERTVAGAAGTSFTGSGSTGWDDFRKASRDMKPLRGATGPGAADVGVDGLGAGEYGVPGRGGGACDRTPDESSAIILRIEARISSMLGSALDSSLDIPYLLATRRPRLGVRDSTGPSAAEPLSGISTTIQLAVWWQVAENPQRHQDRLSPESGTLKAASGR